MLTFKHGSIFDAHVEALVNPVNCVGVMGAGLALEFGYKFYNASLTYKRMCYLEKMKIGKVLVTQTKEEEPKYIIHFPTKDHWRHDSKLEYIDAGLKDLREVIINYKIKSIAIPHLGCGCGKLKWEDVKELIRLYLGDLVDVDIQIINPPHPTHGPYIQENENA